MASNINIVPALQSFAQELRDGPHETRRQLILAILERWQHDTDLTAQSRAEARELLVQFTGRGH